MTHSPLLITGVSGHLGRHVAHILLHGSQPLPAQLIGTTRTPDRVADLCDRMTIRAADFAQPDTLPAAFAGARRMVLTSLPAETAGPRRVALHRHAIDAARKAGVAHIAYTSFLASPHGPLAALATDHVETEALICASGDGTALRNAFYMEMLLTTLPSAIRTGVLPTLDRRTGVAWVSRDDCAQAAAAALLGIGRGIGSQGSISGTTVFEITGPEAVTPPELAEMVNSVMGSRIVVREYTADALLARLCDDGTPEPIARMLVNIERALAAGAMSIATRDVETLTGQRATSVVQWLETHRDKLLRAATAAN